MASFEIRPKARRDLEQIWSYSADRWSPQQADAYLRGLDAAFRQLVDHPFRGLAIEQIRPGYRILRSASHLVVYRLNGGRIEIVRVLHQNMDPERHL